MGTICDSPAIDRERRWLTILLLVGLLTRLVAVCLSTGIIHPDEHQQYMEQAFRWLHGYGACFWEQDRGIRHPLFPMMLGQVLRLCECAGIDNPHVQAGLLRLTMALLTYGAMSFLSWTLFLRGERFAALALAFMLAISVDLLFMQVRVLSEVAAIAPLALALAWWPARPLFTGLALGTMIALRLQTAPLAVGLLTVGLYQDVRAGTPTKVSMRLTIGLGLALLAAGWQDYLYHGTWFHSFLTSLTAQWVEDGASQFGVSPANRILVFGVLQLLRASIFALALFTWGLRRRLDLGWIVLLFVVAHSMVPHKEERFLWPLAPAGCLLLASAFADLYRRGFFRRRGALACLAASMLIASVARVGMMQWRGTVYGASCCILTQLGKRDDLHGVALVDMPRWACGNYFFLRRNVPIDYLFAKDVTGLTKRPGWLDGTVNYLVAPRGKVPANLLDGLTAEFALENWVIYRRKANIYKANEALSAQ